MEFIKQKDTDIVIDLRELAKIHWLREFQELCLYLETEQLHITFVASEMFREIIL